MGHGTAERAAAASLVLSLLAVSSLGQGTSWYRGCYNEDAESPVLPYQVNESDFSELTAVSCSRYCYKIWQEYAGILNGSTCFCGADYIYSNYGTATDNKCNVLCPGDTSLPCGGHNTTSIYSVYGPYIVSISISAPRVTIQENENVAVEVTVELAGSPDTPLDVVASNPMSSLQASLNITIIPPVPADLEIGRLAGSGKIPSCIPEHSAIPEDAVTVSGFVDTEIEFQASVVLVPT
ncbi:sialate:O-sulfotransferase 1-like [Ptychodera flava]|uniref:sialate:O-sulfotransferase 1-like n=1 Tax=Ptychodera flava TaxID=63121 RepID=UPI003969FBFC